MEITFVLGSASSARLKTLRSAGLDPQVLVPEVDEDKIRTELPRNSKPEEVVEALACAKAKQVTTQVSQFLQDKARGRSSTFLLDLANFKDTILVLGCDSMLLQDGQLLGKPHTAERALENIRRLSLSSPILYTGHCLYRIDNGEITGWEHASSRAKLHFSELSEAEIRSYIRTGEPLEVAGSFTIDGLGGPFIKGIEGDYHGIVGVSLPLVRRLASKLGIFWPDLWTSKIYRENTKTMR